MYYDPYSIGFGRPTVYFMQRSSAGECTYAVYAAIQVYVHMPAPWEAPAASGQYRGVRYIDGNIDC